MSYTRPGIEITQVQQTAGPNLIAPDLSAFVCGPAYKVVSTNGTDAYSYAGNYATTIAISGLSSSLYLDSDSVYVEIIGNSGASSDQFGNMLYFSKGSSGFSVNYEYSTNSGIITLPAAPATWPDGSTFTANKTSVRVGYRALKLDKNQFITVESISDIENKIGTPSPFNPLGLAASIALANANAQVFAYGTGSDDLGSIRTNVSGVDLEHGKAMNVVALQEVYAIAPLTYNPTALSSWQSHCVSHSAATGKKERIMFGPAAPDYTWTGTASTDAIGIRDANSSILQKRRFATWPDTVMYKMTAHVGTIKPSYFAGMFGTSYNAVLKQNVTSGTSVLYYADTEITETVWTELAKLNTSYFDVELPIPGYYGAAAAVGMVSGYPCEQGFTNMPVAGISKVKGASDTFSDSQLNTIASGGTYILWQPTKFSPVTCRHQLSTDMSSVEARELNITKSIDFVSKFVRNSISSTIGRNNVTPAFLNLLTMSLKGIGTSLVRDGRVNGFNVLSVAQDTVNKDTILVSIEVLPKYPVNYIKINLIF